MASERRDVGSLQARLLAVAEAGGIDTTHVEQPSAMLPTARKALFAMVSVAACSCLALFLTDQPLQHMKISRFAQLSAWNFVNHSDTDNFDHLAEQIKELDGKVKVLEAQVKAGEEKMKAQSFGHYNEHLVHTLNEMVQVIGRCSLAADGSVGWHINASGDCAKAPCNITGSNFEAGPGCACAAGYVGTPAWVDFAWSFSCKPETTTTTTTTAGTCGWTSDWRTTSPEVCLMETGVSSTEGVIDIYRVALPSGTLDTSFPNQYISACSGKIEGGRILQEVSPASNLGATSIPHFYAESRVFSDHDFDFAGAPSKDRHDAIYEGLCGVRDGWYDGCCLGPLVCERGNRVSGQRYTICAKLE